LRAATKPSAAATATVTVHTLQEQSNALQSRAKPLRLQAGNVGGPGHVGQVHW